MNRVIYVLLSFALMLGLFPVSEIQAAPSLPQRTDAPDITADDNALILDGAGDYLRIDDHPELNPTSAISIEAWVNPDDTVDCQTVLGKNYTRSYWLGICNGKIRFYAHGSTSVPGAC